MILFQLSIVTSQGGASGSGSGVGVKPMDKRVHKFITLKITSSILDATPIMFGTIKEGIVELMDKQLRTLREEISTRQKGAQTPSFQECKACEAPKLFGG